VASGFNIEEIFQIAEQIERNGAQYYRIAADLLKHPVHKQLVLDLAAMEDEHERTFASMRAQLVKGLQRDTRYEPDDLAAQYLWAWADKVIFDIEADPFDVLTADAGAKQILEVALGREKDSVVYYEGLKAGLNADDDKNKVQAIIEQEMLHIALLGKQLKRLHGER